MVPKIKSRAEPRLAGPNAGGDEALRGDAEGLFVGRRIPNRRIARWGPKTLRLFEGLKSG